MNKDISIRELYELIEEQGLLEVLSKLQLPLRIAVPISGSSCSLALEELNLSVRSYNGLKRAGINNIGELVDLINNGDINRIRNLGKKSITEVKTKLLVEGYDALSDRKKLRFLEKLLEFNGRK